MRHPRRMRNHRLEALERRQLLTVTIDNVLPIALQTPHIETLLRRTVGGAPLTGSNSTFDIDALFNTASPGIVLDSLTSNDLGVQQEQTAGANAVFSQDYPTGSIDFGISESLDMSLASYNPLVDPGDSTNYTQDTGQQFMEIGTLPTSSDPNDVVAAMVGPQAVVGQVVVMDPTSADSFDDTIRTYVYPPGTPFNTDPDTSEMDPGIPTVSNTVQLSYGDDSRFTSVTPGTTNSPRLHRLIFVGPNPIDPTLPDNTPPVGFSLGASNGSGSFLLDTGSATSMLSLAKAASLGVTYQAGTFNTANAALVGVPTSQQFRLTVQSFAGPVTLAGFYADTLTLQSDNGPIEYDHVPLLVGDIALGSAPGAQQTLDGVLGMNLFSASASLDSQGNLNQQSPGAFNWITLDESNKTLGLDVASLAAHPHVTSASFNYSGTQQSITMTFTGETSGPAGTDLTLTNQVTGDQLNTSIAADYDPATHTATFTFPDMPNGMLPDGNYTASLFSGAVLDDNGAGLGNDFTLAFWTDQADANHDRAVNALDFNAVAANLGKPNAGFANGDFNYDGTVNTADFAILAATFNQSFIGPDAPGRLLAPGSVLAPPSGAAAPASPLASLFGTQSIAGDEMGVLD